MSIESADAPATGDDPPLALKASAHLQAVPLERVPAPPRAAGIFGDAQAAPAPGEPPHVRAPMGVPVHAATWVATSAALLAKLDDILPDSPDPFEKARTIYVTAIGETNSRREATLIDLHQLRGKLKRRRERGDNVAALLLLQQHLVDFRYTSPWVFLELLELYRLLDRPHEWDIARDAFRKRFGQNAPSWAAPCSMR